MRNVDVTVVGGGIVGLATMYRLQERFPQLSTSLIEKESQIGQHQTGHNSGVLHSGIYYRPGSSKAINCREGKAAMETFCEREAIPFDICGKVIVATREDEFPALERIHERGQQNGVECALIGPDRLQELEPHSAGLKAIHVPRAGIVDYVQVCQRLAEKIRANGCALHTSTRVTRLERRTNSVVIQTTGGEIESRYLVNCTGLHSDRITRLSGVDPRAKIVPFRGEYYELKPHAHHLCRNLIYPVPDPKFPFLGVHFTRMIDNSVECGPNAVLAFAREGYRKRDIHLGDLWEALTYRGFQRMAFKYWRMGLHEMWRSFSKAAFVRALQRLIPEIKSSDLVAAPAGVRAQAVTVDGQLVDDFLILDDAQVVNVCNAPSPAATSSLNIGATIVERLAERF